MRGRGSSKVKDYFGASRKDFPPFRLDLAGQCLWRRQNKKDDERILLTPKAFAGLRYLVEHAGQLVTHDGYTMNTGSGAMEQMGKMLVVGQWCLVYPNRLRSQERSVS